ncbi:glycosyltransferase family 9 protein [Arthrobacter sp. YAF34]|uniref:glycosyltransferase family 9 protein n=1 Tax=Arthrobacter sp. YAF34 TaxID=3233083 RepID=UPI003F90AFC1
MGGSGDDGRPVLVALRALKLGDLLVAVPALHALRRAYPHHRLLYAAPGWLEDAVALVGGFELLPTQGLDEPLALTPGVVDVAVNLHGRGPQSQRRIAALRAKHVISHAPDLGSGPIDAASFDAGPAWVEGIHERERWTRLLQWHGIDADPQDLHLSAPVVPTTQPGATIVHVGAAYGSRLWPAERFAEVSGRLRQAGHTVVFTGSETERGRALEVAAAAGIQADAVLAGRQLLREFAALIADARLVISADTGAAHLASAYGRPSVVLFGPVTPAEWGPPPGPHIVLTKAELRRGDAFARDPDPALLGVAVHDVLDAVRDLGRL